MLTIDQALLLELDAHPDATAEDLHRYLQNAAPLTAIARWLRAHEGWLVVREATRWRLAPSGEGFLAALD
jgi:hypothetical protein